MEQDSFKQISSLVEGRLPEFVRVDHPTIIAFLEAYYEWLQSKTRSGKIMSPMVLEDVIDIDTSMDQFLSQFKREYLLDFPETLAISEATNKPVDVRKLMKNIKSFYRAKGTEKSYELLFRILYDTAVEFYYPKKDILRASDAKWYEKNSIKVSNVLGDRIFESVGRIIYQRNSEGKITSSAKVTDVTLYQQGPYEVAELVISGRNGTFSPGSRGIQFDVEGEVLRELRVYSVVASVNITNGGSGYSVGDKVSFAAAGSDSGEGAFGSVSLVTSTGSIRRIKIENFGINYEAAPTVTIQSLGGSGFVGTSTIASICQSEGYYLNSDGRLNTRKVLQDNHYYQDYSYVLKSEVVIDEYRDSIRRLVHPAGMGMFGQVLIKRCAREDIHNSSALIRYEVPIIGHYVPYTFNTFDNLRDWFSIPATGGSAGTNIQVGYNPTKHDPLIVAGIFSAGPVENTTKGNPITNAIPFSAATGASFPVLGQTGFQNADPFWIVYEHPNRKIKGTVIAQVWRDQIDDFVTWNEWRSFTGSDAPSGWTADFYTDTSLEKKYAFLEYTDKSTFRKITARSFLEMPIGQEFDCRVESREAYARPSIYITNPLNGQSYKSNPQNLLTIAFVVQNFENCIHFVGNPPPTVTPPFKFKVSLDSRAPIYLNPNQRTQAFESVGVGNHILRVELVDYLNQPVIGISDSVVFAIRQGTVSNPLIVTGGRDGIVDPIAGNGIDIGTTSGGEGGGGGQTAPTGPEVEATGVEGVDDSTLGNGIDNSSGGGNPPQPQGFKILYDNIPKTGIASLDAEYQASFDAIGAERLYLIGEQATGIIGGQETPVVNYVPYDGVTPASVNVNIDALASHLVGLGIEPLSTVKKYVSLNINESVWDIRMNGQQALDMGITGDTVVNGPSNTLVSNQVKNTITALKPIFGQNVKFTAVGWPYIPFYFGYQGGSQYDPNGSWWDTTDSWRQLRLTWAIAQHTPLYQGCDWANEHVYDYSPRARDVETGLVAPPTNSIYSNPTLGAIYKYDQYGEAHDNWMLASVDAVKNIARDLNKGSSFEHIPIYSRYYIGGNVFHFSDTGHLIPIDDVLDFIIKMKQRFPAVNGISFWGQNDYAVNLLPCWETVPVPGEPEYITPTRIPEWASFFSGTLEQWQAYYAQDAVRVRGYQNMLRDSYIRILYNGVSPFGGTYRDWTDPDFKIDLTKKYNDYTLELYRRIKELP